MIVDFQHANKSFLNLLNFSHAFPFTTRIIVRFLVCDRVNEGD